MQVTSAPYFGKRRFPQKMAVAAVTSLLAISGGSAVGPQSASAQSAKMGPSLQATAQQASKPKNPLWARNVDVYAAGDDRVTYMDDQGSYFMRALLPIWRTGLSLRDAFNAVVAQGVAPAEISTEEDAKELGLNVGDLYQAQPTASPNPRPDGWVDRPFSQVLILTSKSDPETDPNGAKAFPADTAALSDFLKTQYGANVTVLTDPSERKIKKTIARLGKEGKQNKNDQVLIYIGTHGYQEKRYYRGKNWAERNMAGVQFPRQPYDTNLDEPILKAMVNQKLAPTYRRVNILVDSCYSGSLTQ